MFNELAADERFYCNYRPLSEASEDYVFTGICLFNGVCVCVCGGGGRVCLVRGGG